MYLVLGYQWAIYPLPSLSKTRKRIIVLANISGKLPIFVCQNNPENTSLFWL